MLLVVVGNGEAVRLLLHRADQGEQRGRLPNAQLLPPGGDQGAGAVPVVLHHAQHRHVQSQPGHHLLGDAGVVFAAVDQQQVWQGRKFFVPVQIPAEAAGQHLPHGAVVVPLPARLHPETAVGRLQRPAVLKDHHAAHLIVAAGVGDVVALHPPGQGGQLRQLLQLPQCAADALGGVRDPLHLLPCVAMGDIQQGAALAALGHPDGHGVTAALRQQGGQRVRVLHSGRQQDLPRQGLAGQVVLRHHGGQQHVLAVGGVGEYLRLPRQQVAVFNVQHRHAGTGGTGIRAPYVGIGADTGDDPLLLAQHRQGLDLIPQGGGRLEVQRLRRGGHFLRQLSGDGAQPPLQQGCGLRHAAAVLLPVRLTPAKAVAPTHVEVQAGALLADVPRKPAGAGGQPQGGAYGVQRQPRFVPPAEGSVVPRAVIGGAVHQRKPGIARFFIQPHKGIALVVLQENVIPGLVPLDEGVFQHQRLELRADDDGVEPVHMRHHHLCFLVVAGGVLKILADAVFQFFGLAHIDDLPGLVHHQIDTGQQGQLVGLGAQLIACHRRTPPRLLSFPQYTTGKTAEQVEKTIPGTGTGKKTFDKPEK